jgi:outer membrane protein TolC
MQKVLLFVVFTLLFFTGICAETNSNELQLSLNDALTYAMENNFDIKISRVDLKVSDANLYGSKSIYDPLLSFNWDASVNRQPTTNLLQVGETSVFTLYQSRQDKFDLSLSQMTPWGQSFSMDFSNIRSRNNSKYSFVNPTYDSSLSFGTSLPLLRNSGYLNTNRAILKAKIDKDTATYTFKKNLRDSLISVENAYWNLAFAREQFQVTKKSLEVAKEFQKETAKRISVGTLAPIEQVSADAQVAQREEELISAENQITISEDILKLLLGIKKESDEWNKAIITTDLPNIEIQNYNEENSIKEAIEKREEITEIKNELEKSRIDTKTAKANLLPSLNLNGSLTYVGSAGDYYLNQSTYFVDQNFNDSWDMITGRDYKSWSVGLYLTVPVGNRAQKFQYQNYKLAENRYEIMLEKTKQSIISEVRSSYRKLLNSEKSIAAAEANLKLQNEKLDAERKKFNNGLSTSFNVLSYQNDVLSAESSYLKAKIDHQTAISNLEKAIGRYLDFRGIVLEGVENE